MRDLKSLTLYLVRHGECEHNVEGWIGSHDNSPLTERGRAQARANGKLLREVAASFDGLAFYASSLHRTCVTMELLREAAGLPPTGYRADHRIMEQHTGDHIRAAHAVLRDTPDDRFASDPWNYRRPGGESFGDVFDRVGRFLASLESDAVVVTHAQPARMLRAHYLGLSREVAMEFQPPNAGLIRLSLGTEAFFGD